jgi:EF hand
MHLSFLLFPLLAALPQAPEAQPSAPPRPVSPILLALDLNSDGILDAGELAAAAKSLLKLNKNGDGQLTPAEYRPPRPDGQTSAPLLLKKLDRNGDGRLTPGEYRPMPQTGSRPRADRP